MRVLEAENLSFGFGLGRALRSLRPRMTLNVLLKNLNL
jgi:hypothetical protein